MAFGFATGECNMEDWATTEPESEGLIGSDEVAQAAQQFAKYKQRYVIATSGPDSPSKFTCGSASGFKAFVDRFYDKQYLVGIDLGVDGTYTKAEVDALVARAREIQAVYPTLRIT